LQTELSQSCQVGMVQNLDVVGAFSKQKKEVNVQNETSN
jgi:hypothetical protein